MHHPGVQGTENNGKQTNKRPSGAGPGRVTASSLLQLDCGIHPGLEGMDALPYIDLIDPAEIDLLLISQSVSF